MSKDKPTIGMDGQALPLLPPEREGKVLVKLVRVMFYTPGFLALILLKAGEPAGFGITVEAYSKKFHWRFPKLPKRFAYPT